MIGEKWISVSCQYCGYGMMFNPKKMNGTEIFACKHCGDKFHIWPDDKKESIYSDQACYDKPITLEIDGQKVKV